MTYPVTVKPTQTHTNDNEHFKSFVEPRFSSAISQDMLNIQPCLAFGLFAVTVVLLRDRPAARSCPTEVGKQFALITFQKKLARAITLTVWVSEPYFDVQYYHYVSNR